MIIDLRTYTMVPGRLGAYLKLYEAEGLPIHIRHLGQPIGIFTTDVGTVNQVVFFWGFESSGGPREATQCARSRSRLGRLSPEKRGSRQRAASGVQDHQVNQVLADVTIGNSADRRRTRRAGGPGSLVGRA